MCLWPVCGRSGGSGWCCDNKPHILQLILLRPLSTLTRAGMRLEFHAAEGEPLATAPAAPPYSGLTLYACPMHTQELHAT
jgi:hypothetical protein